MTTNFAKRQPRGRKLPREGGTDMLDHGLEPNLTILKYAGGLTTQWTSSSNSAESSSNVRTMVKKVDLKVQENARNHHTSAYEISSPLQPNPTLVVRRGQSFLIDVELSQPYDEGNERIKLVFGVGNKPSIHKGTYVDITLNQEAKPNRWHAKTVSNQGTFVTIEVTPTPGCAIGKWFFAIDSVMKDDSTTIYRYEHKDGIYLIFNPWCREDAVYMADTNLLNEYILNETGKIYTGTWKTFSSRPWNYSQFNSVALNVALYILDLGGLDHHVRANPVFVIRKISQMVNEQDDGGVIVGSWSGDYSGGTKPTSWTGSAAILEEYWKTKLPVNFGQCWVFAGVANTIARALGIPSRCVTNYESAIDGDHSFTLERYINEEGYELPDRQDDSVWNFHVWNEAWMARYDLATGYGGWQAYDATPKMISDGVMCCGPTSVMAVKLGDVNLPYDGSATFSDVNGDIFYWWPDPRDGWLVVNVDKSRIGKNISTKAPLSDEREDITHLYKFKEGSPEERAAVLKASRFSSDMSEINEFYKSTAKDVEFTVELPSDCVIGRTFEVQLKMKNTSMEKRTVKGKILVASMIYTGVTANQLTSEPFSVALQPGEEMIQKTMVKPEDYQNKLKEFYMLTINLMAKVNETAQIFTTFERSRFSLPELFIKAPSEVEVNRMFEIEVSFTNPLTTSLTHSVIIVDGIASVKKFPQKNVPPLGTFKTSLPSVVTKAGPAEIIVIFSSVELAEITGTHKIIARAA